MRTSVLRTLAVTTVAVGLAVPAGVTVAATTSGATSGAHQKNGNFTGHWTVSNGVGWTVTHQAGSGKCAGTSDLQSSGYGFVGCRVTGDHYRFVVTDGSDYRSVNTGTFHGRKLKGVFDDGSTKEAYTAVKDKKK